MTFSLAPIACHGRDEHAARFPGYSFVSAAGDVTPWGTVQQFATVLLRRQ